MKKEMDTTMAKRGAGGGRAGPPAPAEAPERGVRPATVTFFVTAAERAAVLAALRRRGPDRSAALLAALGVGAIGRGRGGPARGRSETARSRSGAGARRQSDE